MTTQMTDEQLQRAAEFYGVSMDEARRRNQVMIDHGDHPDDPICVGCVRRPHEINDYVIAAMQHEDDDPTDDQVRQYVLDEEGTLNMTNGHFLCDECYIKNGQPSKPFPDRWVCP